MKSALTDWSTWRGCQIEGNFGRIRSLSSRIIREVEGGALLDETIHKHFARASLSDTQKSLIYEITSGVVRWKGYFEWLLSHFLTRATKPELRYLLWISLYQVFFMNKADYHVVKETVDYVKREHGKDRADFVNAILRKCIREREAIPYPRDDAGRFTVQYSFPAWLVHRWLGRLGKEATESLLSLLNRPPAFGLRIDTNRISPEEVSEKLSTEGMTTKKGIFLDSALSTNRLGTLLKDPLFTAGLIHIQDEASQLAVLTLNPKARDVVLDACAGLGTKTVQILEVCPEARLVAADIDRNKLNSIEDARVFRVQTDVLKHPFSPEIFDKILLDAPCSSCGIIRKHPEIRWKRREEEIAQFHGIQLAMLRSLWGLLKKGGSLVYSVCSFEPEETTAVVHRFSEETSFLLENPLPFLFNKEYFLSLPHETDMDGFFIAKLRKA